MSWRVTNALKAFLSGKEQGLEVSSVRDFDPPGTTDPSWIKRFANDGGHAVLSGDHRIREHWPNLIAYTESGLISFFPPPKYGNVKGYAKAALYILWFPVIIEKIKISPQGTVWRLPFNWTPSINKLEQLIDPRLDTAKKRTDIGILPWPNRHQMRARR